MFSLPELPEVETVRKGLEQLVVGKKIANVTVYWDRIVAQPEVSAFKNELKGQTIEAIQRRGKYLVFQLSTSELISHLRMEGKYEYTEQSCEVKKHTHVIFQFTDGSQLRYLDVRKFGRMALVAKGTAKNYKGIRELGPEPLENDFSAEVLGQNLQHKQQAIKAVLLGQKAVAGLGNIYVDEALFLAKIHPETPAKMLGKQEIQLLYQSIVQVLEQAVAAGGTTIRTYHNALGNAGKFQVSLNVYGQAGQPCPRCGQPIEKIRVAQRGTHICPNCQKKVG